MKIKYIYMLLAATALMSGYALADPVNVITNGDFEAGNTGFSSDYTFSPGNIWDPATYDIVSDPNDSHNLATSFGDHTTGDGLMMVIRLAPGRNSQQIGWPVVLTPQPSGLWF